jgi:hypothetical protein
MAGRSGNFWNACASQQLPFVVGIRILNKLVRRIGISMQSHLDNQALNMTGSTNGQEGRTQAATAPLSNQPEPIIWTPPFIITFALLTIAGLSIAALVAHIWANSGIFSPQRVYMIYAAILFLLWATIILRAHNAWIRLGGAFACIWALVTGIQFWFSAHGIDMQATLMIQVRMTASCALLGSFICLSCGRSPLRRWDTFLLWLLPLILCAYLAVSYLKAPASTRLLFTEGKIVALTTYLSVAIWWLRPSCWKTQAGPAFIFGVATILLYYLTKSGQINIENNVFLQQIFFLCLFLGALRILQRERHTESKRIVQPVTSGQEAQSETVES